MDIVEFVESSHNDTGVLTINASDKVIGVNIFNEGDVNVQHSFGDQGYSRTLLPLSGRDYSVNEGQIIQGKLYYKFDGSGTKKLIITKQVLRNEC